MNIYYVFVLCIVVILALRAWFKIQSGFWSQQPVFHKYRLDYWLRKPHIIENGQPKFRKNVNHTQAITSIFDEMSDNVIEQICRFIRSHYLRTKDAIYSPSNSHILTPLKHNQGLSYITQYFSTRNLYMSDGTIVKAKTLTGVITTRHMEIVINGSTMPVLYVDNLCVHTRYRSKGIAPQLIQTNTYDTRIASPSTMVHLFKQEGELTAIVPIVRYWTYLYMMPTKLLKPLPSGVSVTCLGKTSLKVAWDMLQNASSSSLFAVIPSFAVLAECIDKNIIFLYLLVDTNGPLALYVIRDPSLSYGETRGIECVASVCQCTESLFNIGFVNAIISASNKLSASKLLIENIGDNCLINDYLNTTTDDAIGRSSTAYFFYNYANPTIPAEKVIAIA